MKAKNIFQWHKALGQTLGRAREIRQFHLSQFDAILKVDTKKIDHSEAEKILYFLTRIGFERVIFFTRAAEVGIYRQEAY